jgi:hypothetical protein
VQVQRPNCTAAIVRHEQPWHHHLPAGLVTLFDGTPTNHFGVVDAAMSGLDVVFTGVRIAPGSPGYEPGYSFQMISTNAGVTWTNTTANSTPRDGRAVAYVNKPSSGGLKVVGEA